MGERIDQFRETFRRKLTSIDDAFDALHARIAGQVQNEEYAEDAFAVAMAAIAEQAAFEASLARRRGPRR